jgi:peptidoglycan-associated lipoprotein
VPTSVNHFEEIRMVISSWRRFAWLFLALSLTSACSRKQPAETAGPAAPATDAPTTPAAGGGSGTTVTDSLALEEQRRAQRAAMVRATLTEHVFFDYDESNLSEDARRILQAKVNLMREMPDLRIRIEGHADERGSDQYNDALGQQRAAAIKRYLVGFGIAESRLEIVTFGEQRPMCQSAEEGCWARNRRAEFQILAGEPDS